MKQLDTDLWISDAPLRFMGLEVGARMTVIRLSDGRLALHSPISATSELVAQVEELGSVATLIAPNLFHHLYVGEWKDAFPDATLYVAPGLDTKRSDLKIAGVLSSNPESAWEGTLDQVFVEGFPFANEVVFFHRPSATLLVCDLAFNIGEGSPGLTRMAFRMMGAYGKLGPTPLERALVKDRDAFRQGLDQVLAWPFERVVMAHGAVCEQGGRDQLVRNYAWVLDRG